MKFKEMAKAMLGECYILPWVKPIELPPTEAPRVAYVKPPSNLTRGGKKRYTLYIRQKGRCAYCNELFNNPDGTPRLQQTLDHKLAKAKGGGNKMSNLALVCSTCNALKADITSYAEAEERCKAMLEFARKLQKMGIIK
jgi:CRISPR/Cas system Type II protein with McrA/HNH and RuvC-like nuclease domain